MSVSRFFFSFGMSLIEVLVALVIFSEAALGLIGLQQKSIQATEAANWHDHAMSLARDVIERIRANPSALSVYQTSANWPLTANKKCDSWSAPCSSTELAKIDMEDIYTQAIKLLPTPAIQVTSCSAIPCTKISWLAASRSVEMTFWLGS